MLFNEKGIAIPLVLIVMVVIIFLGSAAFLMSMTDIKHATIEERQMQAYYLAKSGAKMVAEKIGDEIKTWGTVPEGFNNAWVSKDDHINYDNRKLPLRIWIYRDEDSDDYVIVRVKATIENTSETLEVEVYNDGSLFWRK